MVGVVEQEHVAGRRLGKGRGHGAHGPGHGAHVDRDVVGLGDQAAARVGERDGEVPGRVEDLGVRGSQHGLAHFLGDGGEPGLQNGDEHGIWHGAIITRAAAGWKGAIPWRGGALHGNGSAGWHHAVLLR